MGVRPHGGHFHHETLAPSRLLLVRSFLTKPAFTSEVIQSLRGVEHVEWSGCPTHSDPKTDAGSPLPGCPAPSWENKGPANRLSSGHKGGGESVKAISLPPNGPHTRGPFGILQGWSYAAQFQGLPSFKVKSDNRRATVNVLPTNQLK